MSTDPAQDADPAVKPHVIDLDAVDVTAEDAAERAVPPPEQPDTATPRRAPAGWGWIIAALLVGTGAGGWLYRDLLSAYLPTSAMTAMSNRIGALEVANKTLASDLTAMKQADDKRNADLDTGLGDAVTAASDAKAGVLKIEPRLAALEKDAADAKTVIEELRTGALPASGGTIDNAALAGITQRLAALEKDVAALKAGGGNAENAAMVSALRQALSDLQAKIAGGAPYRADYDRVLRMVPAAGNDFLASYADNGLPNAPGLAAELRKSAASLPKPQPAAAPTGYLSSLWSALTSVVTIRDIGEIDWGATSEEAAKLAEAGKLDQAVATLDGAQGTLPESLRLWRERAMARARLETAAAELAKAVELTLAAKGGGN